MRVEKMLHKYHLEGYEYVAAKKIVTVQEFQIKNADERRIEIQEETIDHHLHKLNEEYVTCMVVMDQNEMVESLNCESRWLEATLLETNHIVEIAIEANREGYEIKIIDSVERQDISERKHRC
jgi:hypothetical protein